MKKLGIATIVPLVLVSMSACRPQEGLTSSEAATASEELKVESQSQALTSNTVELGTNFTIGGAVEDAANELRSFIQSQLSCAAVTVSGHTLTVVYGEVTGCTFHGQSITGQQEITISKNDDSDVVVDHVWTELSNGNVKVSGTAEVTWSKSDVSRHVVHDLKWTRLSDGREGEGKGDRTQRPLPDSAGGLATGFTETGTRSWDGKAGHWSLDIAQLDMRWIDPLPESGDLTLDTPFDKTVSASFMRPNATTIRVTLEGNRGSISLNTVTPP
ncbi:MAG TPA: hypothetical protein VH062_04840 [Polyangiaceae bacterium]|jgi:hypothetical protein|nr:hypothetical protein [Polyangiaceae bacterium]